MSIIIEINITLERSKSISKGKTNIDITVVVIYKVMGIDTLSQGYKVRFTLAQW